MVYIVRLCSLQYIGHSGVVSNILRGHVRVSTIATDCNAVEYQYYFEM